jgi:hypothetical protein
VHQHDVEVPVAGDVADHGRRAEEVREVVEWDVLGRGEAVGGGEQDYDQPAADQDVGQAVFVEVREPEVGRVEVLAEIDRHQAVVP